jgi:hypothetical protein
VDSGGSGAQSHIQWIAGALYSGVKRMGSKDNQCSSSSAEIKNGEAIPHLVDMVLCLIKFRDNFTSFLFC